MDQISGTNLPQDELAPPSNQVEDKQNSSLTEIRNDQSQQQILPGPDSGPDHITATQDGQPRVVDMVMSEPTEENSVARTMNAHAVDDTVPSTNRQSLPDLSPVLKSKQEDHEADPQLVSNIVTGPTGVLSQSHDSHSLVIPGASSPDVGATITDAVTAASIKDESVKSPDGIKNEDIDNGELALQGEDQPMEDITTNPVDGGPAEVEYDSSPYESSSDDTSSDDLNDSDDDYELLDPIEQARRLMEQDGSDDEGGKPSAGGQLRTANEKIEDVVEIPKINMTPETKITELGNIETIVENMILIKAKVSGDYQVLEMGSVLCLEDRTIIGIVAETLGRVQEPLYCVRFTDATTIASFGLQRANTIYYVPEHSTFVFTEALKAIKGSDASNLYDEELHGDEIEFSDDEKEAEYKRQKKLQKQERKEMRGGGSSRGRGTYGGQGRNYEPATPSTLSYDDGNVDDALYTPLARPSSLNQPGQMSAPPQEGYSRGPGGFRGRGDRGRGDRGRGRGRGDRGNRGRGGYRDQSNDRQQPSQSQGYTNQGEPVQQQSYTYPNQQPFQGQPHQSQQYLQAQQYAQPISYQSQGLPNLAQFQQFQQQYQQNQFSAQAQAQQQYSQANQWQGYQQPVGNAPQGQWNGYQQNVYPPGQIPPNPAAPNQSSSAQAFDTAAFLRQFQQQQQRPG